MIQFTLKCGDGHTFDSWFQSSAAYDKLLAAGMVSCAVCGGTDVKKAIMAPRVRPARSAAATPAVETAKEAGAAGEAAGTSAGTPGRPAGGAGALSAPASEIEQALSALKKQVEENSDYVGMNFAAEARAMHDGDAPERPIYGEAKIEDAKSLIEDGIPVAPLPFRTQRKTN